MESIRWLDGVVHAARAYGSDKVVYLDKARVYWCKAITRSRNSHSRLGP